MSTIAGLAIAEIAAWVAEDLEEGQAVNLGIGLPQTVARFIPRDREVILHAENGVLGAGEPAPADEQDWDLIDAGKIPITVVPGASFMSHCDSFALVRGGHIDVSVMGAFEVSTAGDLANWSTGSGGIPGVGGAMDLAKGAKQVFVMMRHLTRDGAPKIVRTCSLPLTASGVVSRIYTDLGVFRPAGDHLEAIKLAPLANLAYINEVTGVPVISAPRQPRRSS